MVSDTIPKVVGCLSSIQSGSEHYSSSGVLAE